MIRVKAAVFTRNVSATIDQVVKSGEPTIVTRRGADLVALVPLVVRLDEGAVARMVAKSREETE